MTTIYAVTYGRYSDWHIMALFSTKEKAEEYRDTLSRKHPYYLDKPNEKIDEYELDLPKEKWIPYVVKISRYGEILEIYVTNYAGKSFFTANGSLVTCVNADDPNRAIKVANERRTVILANNMWGDNEALETLNF